jgi:hypothetical protein
VKCQFLRKDEKMDFAEFDQLGWLLLFPHKKIWFFCFTTNIARVEKS